MTMPRDLARHEAACRAFMAAQGRAARLSLLATSADRFYGALGWVRADRAASSEAVRVALSSPGHAHLPRC